MTKTRSKNAPKAVPAPNLPPLNLEAPSRELGQLRKRLEEENLTDREREQIKRRIRVLEFQLTIPGLNGGGKRTRRGSRRTRRGGKRLAKK